MYYVKGDETLPDCEWNMDIKYQQKENLEALVNERINVLELTDILKIDKNLTISLTKWPLDYAADGLYQTDSFGQTVCDPIDDYKSCHITIEINYYTVSQLSIEEFTSNVVDHELEHARVYVKMFPLTRRQRKIFNCDCQEESCASGQCLNAGHHRQWLKSITALNEDREYHLEITATENRSKNWAKGNVVAAKIYFRRHKIYYHDKNRVYKKCKECQFYESQEENFTNDLKKWR